VLVGTRKGAFVLNSDGKREHERVGVELAAILEAHRLAVGGTESVTFIVDHLDVLAQCCDGERVQGDRAAAALGLAVGVGSAAAARPPGGSRDRLERATMWAWR
jgi:hypothetical protein